MKDCKNMNSPKNTSETNPSKNDTPIIYIDMDDVLNNFSKLVDKEYKNAAYPQLVCKYKIFERVTLNDHVTPLLQVLAYLHKVYNIPIRILSSSGAIFDPLLHEEAKMQKLTWLSKHQIFYPLTLVRLSAGKTSIIRVAKDIVIDDNEKTIKSLIGQLADYNALCSGNRNKPNNQFLLYKNSSKNVRELIAQILRHLKI